MLVESTISLVKEKTIKTLSKRRSRTILDILPFKLKFRNSKIFISILLPIFVGIFVGLLSAFMGVGGVRNGTCYDLYF